MHIVQLFGVVGAKHRPRYNGFEIHCRGLFESQMRGGPMPTYLILPTGFPPFQGVEDEAKVIRAKLKVLYDVTTTPFVTLCLLRVFQGPEAVSGCLPEEKGVWDVALTYTVVPLVHVLVTNNTELTRIAQN